MGEIITRRGSSFAEAADSVVRPEQQLVAPEIAMIVENQQAVAIPEPGLQRAEHWQPQFRLGVQEKSKCRDQIVLPLDLGVRRQNIPAKDVGSRQFFARQFTHRFGNLNARDGVDMIFKQCGDPSGSRGKIQRLDSRFDDP